MYQTLLGPFNSPYLKANARINEQSLAGGFFAAQREKGDR
jgi:hypothetical protein